MGIKYLWTILTPFCETKPLYELQGKTVAIDLSCWICEAQNITEYHIHPRMYLRNLYFRTCYLLLMGINPVFVLEGKAPELKYETIAARNAIQFKGSKPKTDEVKTGKDRSRFHFVLKRCEEMLRYMGLSCITGKGEAESLCAYLNDEGLVDGCISQDSDCFAYGAKIVYRNFSIASQGAYASSGGSVDVYDIRKAVKDIDFGINKIIALALLCGSDYGEGVNGVGKQSVLQLFETLRDEETLDKLRSWRIDTDKYNKFEKLLSDKNICTTCGHFGKVQSHNKNGCVPCGFKKSCDATKFKEKRLKIKNEMTIRSKALIDPKFPNEDLIKEYLIKKDNVSTLDLKWRRPDIRKFVDFAVKYLQWTEIYAFEKSLPILTRWQCIHLHHDLNTIKGVLEPSHIKKCRNPKGIQSYEIIWTDPEDYIKILIPQEQIEESNTTLEKLWSTIEPQVLVEKAYPKLVEKFLESKTKPKKNTKRTKKDKGTAVIQNSSISEPKPKKTRKQKVKNSNIDVLESSFNDLKLTEVKKPTVLDNFLKIALLQSKSDIETNDKDSVCHTSTPSKGAPKCFDLSSFGDEDGDEDLSFIVDNIISKKATQLQELNKIDIKNLVTEDSTEFCDDDNIKKQNTSSFFITEPIENDLFEKTFNKYTDSDEDDESTIEYEIEEPQFQKADNIKNKTEIVDKKIDNDSFCDIYVPLIERIRKKM